MLMESLRIYWNTFSDAVRALRKRKTTC